MELYKDNVLVARFFDEKVAQKTISLLRVHERDKAFLAKDHIYIKAVYELVLTEGRGSLCDQDK